MRSTRLIELTLRLVPEEGCGCGGFRIVSLSVSEQQDLGTLRGGCERDILKELRLW